MVLLGLDNNILSTTLDNVATRLWPHRPLNQNRVPTPNGRTFDDSLNRFSHSGRNRGDVGSFCRLKCIAAFGENVQRRHWDGFFFGCDRRPPAHPHGRLHWLVEWNSKLALSSVVQLTLVFKALPGRLGEDHISTNSLAAGTLSYF